MGAESRQRKKESMIIGCFALAEPFSRMSRQFQAIREMGTEYADLTDNHHGGMLVLAMEALSAPYAAFSIHIFSGITVFHLPLTPD